MAPLLNEARKRQINRVLKLLETTKVPDSHLTFSQQFTKQMLTQMVETIVEVVETDQQDVLVTQYGSVWKVNKKNYKRLLHQIAKGWPYDLDNLGHLVATETVAILDMTQDEAVRRYNALKK